MSVNDMVLDRNGNPAFINTPEKTKQWLVYQIKSGRNLQGYEVRRGSTMQNISLSRYLRGIPLVEEK